MLVRPALVPTVEVAGLVGEDSEDTKSSGRHLLRVQGTDSGVDRRHSAW